MNFVINIEGWKLINAALSLKNHTFNNQNPQFKTENYLNNSHTNNETNNFVFSTTQVLILEGCKLDDNKIDSLLNNIEFPCLKYFNLRFNSMITQIGWTVINNSILPSI